MFVIPIEDSILYVEPVYLEASDSSIPEVKRVIVVYGDEIAYEETLGEALESLFGEGASPEKEESEDDESLSRTELIDKANQAFTGGQEALKNGNWAGYGKYMDQLEEYLNMLKQ